MKWCYIPFKIRVNSWSCILAHVVHRSENSSCVCFCRSILPLRQTADFYKFARIFFEKKNRRCTPCLLFIFINYIQFAFKWVQKLNIWCSFFKCEARLNIVMSKSAGCRQGNLYRETISSTPKTTGLCAGTSAACEPRLLMIEGFVSLLSCWVYKQTDRQTEIQTETESQTDRQAERQTERQIERQTERQTGRQAGRQTDRPTNQHTCQSDNFGK